MIDGTATQNVTAMSFASLVCWGLGDWWPISMKHWGCTACCAFCDFSRITTQTIPGLVRKKKKIQLMRGILGHDVVPSATTGGATKQPAGPDPPAGCVGPAWTGGKAAEVRIAAQSAAECLSELQRRDWKMLRKNKWWMMTLMKWWIWLQAGDWHGDMELMHLRRSCPLLKTEEVMGCWRPRFCWKVWKEKNKNTKQVQRFDV